METIFELFLRNHFVLYIGGFTRFIFLKFILRRNITLNESLYGKKNVNGSINKDEELRLSFNNRLLGLFVSIPIIIGVVYIVF
jgi:hypothetical protein